MEQKNIKIKEKTKNGLYSIYHIQIIILILIGILFVFAFSYWMDQNNRSMLLKAAENISETQEAANKDIDSSYDRLDSYLYNYILRTKDINVLIYDSNELRRYESRNNILEVLDQVIIMDPMIDCSWIYIENSDDPFLFKYANTGILGKTAQQINEHIVDRIKQGDNSYNSNSPWEIQTFDGVSYILWSSKANNIRYGTWVRLSQLVKNFENLFGEDNDIVVADYRTGEILFTTASYVPEALSAVSDEDGILWAKDSKNNLIVKTIAEKTGLCIYTIAPESSTLQKTHSPFGFVIVIILLLTAAIIIVIFTQIFIFYPFRRTLQNLDAADPEKDNLSIPNQTRLLELNRLIEKFNNLLSEITRLKGDIYEAQVKQKEIQCQYLQIRLKTHFYMNCLSIISALAQVKDTDTIQKLTRYLTDYLRFIRNDSENYVTLEEELEHIQNYTHIQMLRFPGMFQYYEDVDMSLMECPIPPIVLETFIENSVKHGMQKDKKITVRMSARYENRHELPGIYFVITDNGNGFRENELQIFSGKSSAEMQGSGIRNVISRLELLYNNKAELSFFNNENGGAVVQMWLPIINSDIEEDELGGEPDV